jgi:hypothetical protein
LFRIHFKDYFNGLLGTLHEATRYRNDAQRSAAMIVVVGTTLAGG